MRSNLSLQVKATDILAECDKLRDITLPDLGVRLEDKEGEKTVIKLVDKEELRKEREEKLALEEKKRLEKEAKKAKAAAEAAKALEERFLRKRCSEKKLTSTVLGPTRECQHTWLMATKCPRCKNACQLTF